MYDKMEDGVYTCLDRALPSDNCKRGFTPRVRFRMRVIALRNEQSDSW